MRLNRFILIFLLSAASYFSSCEQQPRLKVESGNPPNFFVYGKGIIDVIQIRGEREVSSKDRINPWFDCWIIAPEKEVRLEDLEKLNPITYGKVPAASGKFIQQAASLSRSSKAEHTDFNL